MPNAPIVPVALRGLYELWPRGKGIDWSVIWPWSPHRVRIAIGPPITVGEGESYGGRREPAARHRGRDVAAALTSVLGELRSVSCHS